MADGRSVAVKPDAANKQIAADSQAVTPSGYGSTTPDGDSPGNQGQIGTDSASPTVGGVATPSLPRRFFGVVDVEATRLGRDAGRIAQEVLAHLTGLKNAE